MPFTNCTNTAHSLYIVSPSLNLYKGDFSLHLDKRYNSVSIRISLEKSHFPVENLDRDYNFLCNHNV